MSDLISRQAAIDAVKEYFMFSPIEGRQCAKAIERLPSAQPGKSEDAVSREEAKWVVFCNRDHVEDQVNAIDGLPLVRSSAQQWIPCSERLPDEEGTYLVMLDKSNLLDNETQVTDAYWINNQWQYGVLESYEHRMPKLVVEPIEELKVIAWMPLPEPYKGEES